MASKAATIGRATKGGFAARASAAALGGSAVNCTAAILLHGPSPQHCYSRYLASTPGDPSFDTVSASPPQNWLGRPGAYLADLDAAVRSDTPPLSLFPCPPSAVPGSCSAAGCSAGGAILQRRSPAALLAAAAIGLVWSSTWQRVCPRAPAGCPACSPSMVPRR